MIKPTLEQLQDKIYDIFVEFDRVCRKYDIKYSMEGGTLMGAVKYQNFVPWDDDIDVIMKRSDYKKFLEIAPEELGEDYFLQSYHNVKEFPLNYAKICYNKSLIHDYANSHLNMNHGIFIDIFPIDNVIPSKLRLHCAFVGLLTTARKIKLKFSFKSNVLKTLLYKLVSFLPMRTLCHLIDKACEKYNAKETGYCYEICNSNRKFKPLPAEIYDNLIELDFRDKKFYAVKDYDTFLKSRFGENYMNELPDEKDRKPSHCQNILLED